MHIVNIVNWSRRWLCWSLLVVFLVILVVNWSYGELVVSMVVLVVIGCVLGYIIELVLYWLIIGCVMVKRSWSYIGMLHNLPCYG